MTVEQGYEVGQKVWYVPSYRIDKGEERTVSKVARKWVTCTDDWRTLRFDRESGHVEGRRGYGPDGTVYRSRTAWMEEVALEDAWRKFRKIVEMTYKCPPIVTIEQIEAMRSMIDKPDTRSKETA
jgi:hypothetical protein